MLRQRAIFRIGFLGLACNVYKYQLIKIRKDMLKHLGMVSFLLIAFNLTGCAGLANMKEVEFQNAPTQNKATVNFVRRSVFMGDGVKGEVWDGESLVGTLPSGRLLQYQADPGEHTFMMNLQGNWAVAQGDLEAGKTYYLKLNLTGWGPIIIGAAVANDPRIDEWNEMTTIVKDEATSKPVPEKYVEEARGVLKRVADGNANVTRITEEHAN
tara:strand:+ start:727 stop:1362 length:636 start_codon:yes stop_codon:yes gene_type:complete